jgi:hypothetical protein
VERLMTKPPSLSSRSIVATVLAFGIVVAGNVLTNGLGRPSLARLAAACVVIAMAIGYLVWRIRHHHALDELHQRLELEALSVAFAGSFLIFVSYWLLQAAGLLPPLIGMYYALGMLAMAMFGSSGAWRRLKAGSPDRP